MASTDIQVFSIVYSLRNLFLISNYNQSIPEYLFLLYTPIFA